MAAWLLVASMALAGCASTTGPPAHVLRMAIPFDPTSLSPLIAFNQDAIALDLLWCQTLVGLDEHNRFVPVLVTRIPSRENGDISPDGLRMTYHLRRDVKFADGVPFTSADVAFTYHAIFEPVNAAGSTDRYRRIAQLATPDAHTVVITLRKPWSAAVRVLFAEADFAYGILPKHAFKGYAVTGSAWDQKPFGTGPFRVVQWRRGESIELEPNPYFRPKPKLRGLSIRLVPNLTTAFNLLQTHAVDVTELDADNIEQARTIDGVTVVGFPENGLAALYLQTAAGPTSDIRVRRAIAYAIDRQSLSKAWHGVFPLAASVFPPPVVSWNAPALPAYPYDPAAAARELDAAGWRLEGHVRKKNGVPLALVGAIDATSSMNARIAVVVQAQLAALGAGVTVKSYPGNMFSSFTGPLRTGRFSFTPSRLIGGSDPEDSLNLTCGGARDGGDNYARFCSQALDSLNERQHVAPTQAQRERAFDGIAALVYEEVPLIPLYDMIYLQGVNRRVTGYRRNMLSFPVHAEMWDAGPLPATTLP